MHEGGRVPAERQVAVATKKKASDPQFMIIIASGERIGSTHRRAEFAQAEAGEIMLNDSAIEMCEIVEVVCKLRRVVKIEVA